MDTPTLSPECRPLVTNKDRKRKRTTSVQAGFDSDSSSESKQTMSVQSSLEKPDTKRARKRADLNLPGPSPENPPRNNTEKGKSNRKHARRVSSTTKMGAESSIKKFESKDKPVNGDDDDDVSVAGSNVSTGRLRRSQAERIQYFENQPECGKMEPHQVHCLRCNKPVNLGRKQTYTVRPWEIHRARCDQRLAHAVLTAANAMVESESAPESQATPARRPSEQERKEFLESDVQIEKVEEHRVLCRKCQGWFDLDQNAYATGNWVKHKARCSVPSSRVTAAQRRLVLVNDTQAKSFDQENVECTLCGAQIKLEGEGDFNLIKWNEHKMACTISGPNFKKDTVSSIPFPSQPCRPPLSSASTEDTLIDVQGLKRPREEPDHLPHEEMPKVVRPRTDLYLPPAIEPPDSILGWFMMPVHSFVRGFKESMRDQT